jgi:acyl carrier protein
MPNLTSSTLESLTTVFREVFDDDNLQLTATTASSNVEDWDSVAQVKLVLALEERFGVQFTTEEVAGIPSVQRFLKALETRGISD